jgi:hypothetical protein
MIQIAPFALIRSSQTEPGLKRKSRTDDIPVIPSPLPNFPRSIPFLPIPFSVQNSRSSKGDGSTSSWYRRRGHRCRRHQGCPWDRLRHRGRSCRARQRRHPRVAPDEPSHDTASVASAGPDRVVSTGTALAVACIAVGSAPDVYATG